MLPVWRIFSQIILLKNSFEIVIFNLFNLCLNKANSNVFIKVIVLKLSEYKVLQNGQTDGPVESLSNYSLLLSYFYAFSFRFSKTINVCQFTYKFAT